MGETDDLAQRLFARLIATQAVLSENIAEKARGLGLTQAQATVAQDLVFNSGSSLQGICERLGWPKSTVSRLVDELVGKNLVVRSIPEENRRMVILAPTPGLEHACGHDLVRFLFPGANGSLDKPEARRLGRALERLSELLRSHD